MESSSTSSRTSLSCLKLKWVPRDLRNQIKIRILAIHSLFVNGAGVDRRGDADLLLIRHRARLHDGHGLIQPLPQ